MFYIIDGQIQMLYQYEKVPGNHKHKFRRGTTSGKGVECVQGRRTKGTSAVSAIPSFLPIPSSFFLSSLKKKTKQGRQNTGIQWISVVDSWDFIIFIFVFLQIFEVYHNQNNNDHRTQSYILVVGALGYAVQALSPSLLLSSYGNWKNYLTALSLSLLICKARMIIRFPLIVLL